MSTLTASAYTKGGHVEPARLQAAACDSQHYLSHLRLYTASLQRLDSGVCCLRAFEIDKSVAC